MITFLNQCVQVDTDPIPTTLNLTKGDKYTDPVVQTSPENVMLISTVKNQYEINMNQFSKISRPNAVTGSISAYNPSVIEPISQTALLGHLFQWQSTEKPVIMVALFRQLVQVDQTINEISNKDALVWLWTPPKGIIDQGRTTFKEGYRAIWDKETGAYKLSPPTTTLPNGYYVWCILAWDNQGVNIVAASRELPIRITN